MTAYEIKDHLISKYNWNKSVSRFFHIDTRTNKLVMNNRREALPLEKEDEGFALSERSKRHLLKYFQQVSSLFSKSRKEELLEFNKEHYLKKEDYRWLNSLNIAPQNFKIGYIHTNKRLQERYGISHIRVREFIELNKLINNSPELITVSYHNTNKHYVFSTNLKGRTVNFLLFKAKDSGYYISSATPLENLFLQYV